MEKAIEDMTEEAFQKHIQALAIRRLDKPKKLSAECAKYWGEIISQQYNFDRGKTTLVPQNLWYHGKHTSSSAEWPLCRGCFSADLGVNGGTLTSVSVN